MLKPVNYNSKYLYFTTISGIIILNLLLKINFLGAEPFWYDEIISVKASLLDFGHIKHQSEWDNNPPFYYYCLWVWVKLFGVTEFKVRLLSVIFSSASALMLFVLAKRNINYLTAVGASLLFTFHDFSYEFSHETRCYSLVVLLVITSSYFFLSLIQNSSYKTALLLGLFNFLIVYTHYIAGMVLLFQFIFIFFFSKEAKKKFFVSILLTLLLVIIRFTKKQFLVMLSFNKEGKEFWLQNSDTDLLKDTLTHLFSGNKLWIPLLTLFMLAVCFLIFKRRKINPKDKITLIYSITLSIGAILVTYLLGLYKPIFLGRYLLFSIPFLTLFVSWFLFNSYRFLPFALLIIISLQLLDINLNPSKPMNFRLAVAIATRLQKDTKGMIIIQTKDVTGLFAYYYNKEFFIDFKKMQANLNANNIYDIENHTDLNNLTYKEEKTIILCQTFEKERDSNQIFDIFKQNNYKFFTSKAVKGVKISLIRKI